MNGAEVANGSDPGPFQDLFRTVSQWPLWTTLGGAAAAGVAFMAGFLRRARRIIDPRGSLSDQMDTALSELKHVRDENAQLRTEMEGVRNDARGAYERIGRAEERVEQLRLTVDSLDGRVKTLERLPDTVGTLQERLETIADQRGHGDVNP